MNHNQPDLILIALTCESPQLGSEVIQSSLRDIQHRLGPSVIPAIVSVNAEGNSQGIAPLNPRDLGRVVVIPWSLHQVPKHDLRAELWFQRISSNLPVFLANPPSPRELGRWIREARDQLENEPPLEFVLPRDSEPATWDRIAAIAYWAGSQGTCSLREAQLDSDDLTIERDRRCYLAFSPEPYGLDRVALASGPMLRCVHSDRSWDWLPPSAFATWVIGRYLDALDSEPVPFTDAESDNLLLQVLQSLADRQRALLPSEYAKRLDEVAPSSMGSASLVYDPDGTVPWDRIWTSFCDLAMAGGPPHRGTLLGNVPVEEIAPRIEAYRNVVAELRRGIGLASGLATCESETLGWVGVRCHDEKMAAWMLRAIIVENILVRREGAVLYLPAGPDFRVEKEIKNVITAVAKTTHYWLGHLKTRQPPNPL